MISWGYNGLWQTQSSLISTCKRSKSPNSAFLSRACCDDSFIGSSWGDGCEAEPGRQMVRRLPLTASRGPSRPHLVARVHAEHNRISWLFGATPKRHNGAPYLQVRVILVVPPHLPVVFRAIADSAHGRSIRSLTKKVTGSLGGDSRRIAFLVITKLRAPVGGEGADHARSPSPAAASKQTTIA